MQMVRRPVVNGRGVRTPGARRDSGRAAVPRAARAVAEAVEARVLFAAEPVISEFMALNDHGLVDDLGRRSDWVEIHNPGTDPLDLNGYYLTDDASAAGRRKWQFPAVTIAPGGHLLVYASDENRRDPSR